MSTEPKKLRGRRWYAVSVGSEGGALYAGVDLFDPRGPICVEGHVSREYFGSRAFAVTQQALPHGQPWPAFLVRTRSRLDKLREWLGEEFWYAYRCEIVIVERDEKGGAA